MLLQAVEYWVALKAPTNQIAFTMAHFELHFRQQHYFNVLLMPIKCVTKVQLTIRSISFVHVIGDKPIPEIVLSRYTDVYESLNLRVFISVTYTCINISCVIFGTDFFPSHIRFMSYLTQSEPLPHKNRVEQYSQRNLQPHSLLFKYILR